MEWDELSDTGRMWRVRVQLLDRPGSLAALTERLSARGCNLLGVSVLPVDRGTASARHAGKVIDEFVLRAPSDLEDGDLARLIEADGLRCGGVSPASAGELVDAETAVLRAATAALTGRSSIAEALRRVLGADSVTRAPRSAQLCPLGSPYLDDDDHRAHFTLPTLDRLVAVRAWAPFTSGELSRATALLDLVDARSTASVPDLPTEAPSPPRREHARQLTALDAQFLNIETPTSHMHVGNLIVLDPSGLPGRRLLAAALRDVFASRLHMVAPLRWRLREVPLGLDLPYWEDANYVDLHYHVREITLPAPGTDAQLSDLVGTLAASPLDRRFPLWEVYLISGLSDGRQALYAKVHHAVVDGVSGAEVMAMVLDLTPEPMQVPRPPAQATVRTAPGSVTMIGRGLARSITRPIRGVQAVPGLVRHMSHMFQPVPRAPFNGSVSAERTYAFTSLPLADVKAIKTALGQTVNDVVMALCTTALRRWLLAHGALPDTPLVASVPVSIRPPEQVGKAGNQISLMQVAMPTDEPDALRRVDLLRTGIRAAKAAFDEMPTTLVPAAAGTIPQVLHGVVPRLLLRATIAATTPTNLIVSNVPGPQIPLYAAGARVTGCFPVSLVTDVSGGVNITVMSYSGSLDFGIVACPHMVPDVSSFVRYLWDALDELTDLAGRERRSTAEWSALPEIAEGGE